MQTGLSLKCLRVGTGAAEVSLVSGTYVAVWGQRIQVAFVEKVTFKGWFEA